MVSAEHQNNNGYFERRSDLYSLPLLEFKCLFDCWSLSFFDVCRQG